MMMRVCMCVRVSVVVFVLGLFVCFLS